MIVIRHEEKKDIKVVRKLNEIAFGRPDEANLIDALRRRGAYTLSLVATLDELVVGHIMFSPVDIEIDETVFTGVGLGPMAVLPHHQNRGIGSQLVQRGVDELREMGHAVIVVLGHPSYYPRFGFVPASGYGIVCEYGVPDEVFMALLLDKDFLRLLNGKEGKVKYQPEFDAV